VVGVRTRPPSIAEKIKGSEDAFLTSAELVLSVNAFHEKAGRSQVDSSLASLNKVCSPAEWPPSPCFHPHSRRVSSSRFLPFCYILLPDLLRLSLGEAGFRLARAGEYGTFFVLLEFRPNARIT
jgi:hypothetical protein